MNKTTRGTQASGPPSTPLAVPAPVYHNTYDMVTAGSRLAPDAPALSFFLDVKDHHRPFVWSHRQLHGEITRAANAFRRLGVQRGDVIAMVLPNLPEAHWTLWGGEAAAIVMPVNPLLEPATIASLLNAAGAKALVTLAPTPRTDIWEKVTALLPQVASIRTVLTVSPLRYMRGPLGAALRLQSRMKTPSAIGQVQVLDLSQEMKASHGQAPLFDLPHLRDIASYFCTGGTTGIPKIARRTHETEVSNSQMVSALLADELKPGETLFCGLPLFHVNAQLGSGLIPWSRGAHVLLGTPQGYRGQGVVQRFWELVEHHRIISFSGVPTVYSALMKVPRQGRDLSSLKVGICGAAPLPAQLLTQFEQATGIKILEGYGLTEAGCVSTLNPREGSKAGSIGQCVPGQRLLAVILDEQGRYLRDAEADEVGILAVNGPNTFAGYLEASHNKGLWIDRPEPDGRALRWLNTGDMGRIDREGFVFLTGRKKELIIRGGHNIDPKTIEEALHGHPAVAVAAAIGRPDAYAGEVPVAYVQLHPGSTATADDLQKFAETSIGERAAMPKRIQIVDVLPTTAVGKVFKPALTMMEIEDVVAAEAARVGVALGRVEVVQDPQRGFVAHYEAQDTAGLLQGALGQYTFATQARPMRTAA